MADNDAAFDNLKKEIRSLLMPLQKGCTLFEFRKDYRLMLGRSIPAEKFGYQDDVELLYAIPDVVSIYKQGGDYKLTVVADETTQHIQKMVAVQKPAKKKPVKSTRYNKYSSRYVPSRPPFTGNRPSSFSSRPSPAASYNSSFANNTSSFGSRLSPAVSNTAPFVSRPSPAVSNTSSFLSRPSPTVSNSTPFVSRPSSIGSNTAPFVSRPSPAVSNTSSFVSRPSSIVGNTNPVVSRPSPVVSNPTPFVSRPSSVMSNLAPVKESTPAASNSALVRRPAPVSSKPATSTFYSEKFKKDLPPRFRATSSAKLLPPDVECQIVNVVRMFPTGLRMRDFSVAYFRNHNQQFLFDQYGFHSLQECLETIPDLSMTPLNNNDFTIYYSGRRMTESDAKPQEISLSSGSPATGKLIDFDSCAEPAPTFKKDKATEIFKFNGSWANPPRSETYTQSENASQRQNQNARSFNREPGSYNFYDIPQVNEKSVYYQDNAVFKTTSSEEGRRTPKSKADALDTFELREDNVGLTENMRKKFGAVMSRNKNGIWAKEFPSTFEEVTQTPFDLHSLGFTDLAGLVDSVPDILRRKRVRGSRKDWIIIPAGGCEEEKDINADDGSPKVGSLLIDFCIQNIQQILQGYPEGIPLNSFLEVYSINCNEPLYIVDLGFDCIENFLLSVSDRVPLKIDLEGGCKIVFLGETEPEEIMNSHVPAIHEDELPESIPYDAASPDCQYKKLDLPLDIGTSKYIQVYTSEIIHPGHIYIQLYGPDTSAALNNLYDDIEPFYSGPHSEHYLLQLRHIKERAMCAAFWPRDQLWYRARIISVVSEELVRVFYVDYGTSEVISHTFLRYLKESFTKLPAQALKARVAHVKPPNKASHWGPESKKRMLNLCHDVLLMAQVANVEDGVLSLVLCDTRDGDLFINDVLMQEGLADSVLDEIEPPPPQQQQAPPALDPILVMQAQCYYQMMNTLSLTMTPDQVAKAMQPLSLNYPDNPLVPKTPGDSVFQSLHPGAAIFQSPSRAATYQSHSGVSAYNSHLGANINQAHLGDDPKQSHLGAYAYQSPSVGAPGLDQQSSCASSSGMSSRESPDDESDIFQDDDTLFEEFLQNSCSVSKRYVKRIRTVDGYFFHILIVDAQPYVSSGDISTLIWSDKKPDHLLERLQNRDVVFESRSISEEGNEMMFNQFEKFHVKGIQNGSKTTCIIIYPLQSAIAILNEYGHPSVKLRQQIMSEIESFNPNLPAWQELSKIEIPEKEEEAFRAVTDDDKLNRLCIYDLMAMKDGIRIKKSKLLSDLKVEKNKPPLVDKLEKLENLYQRVDQRITDIRKICSTFS